MTMPTTKLPTFQKPKKATRETSWGMMDLDASLLKSSIHKNRTNKLAASCCPRTTTATSAGGGAKNKPSSVPPMVPPRNHILKQPRETSWGFVDVMEMLDLQHDEEYEDYEDSEEFALPQPTTQKPTASPLSQIRERNRCRQRSKSPIYSQQQQRKVSPLRNRHRDRSSSPFRPAMSMQHPQRG